MITQAAAWPALCRVIGKEAWIEDPAYATPDARLDKLPHIFDTIEEWTKTKTKFEVMDILNEVDVPCGPILSMKEIAEEPSLRATGTVVEVDHPTRGKYLTVGNPIKLSDSPAEVRRSPLLGEHTDEILAGVLGFSEEEIREIKASGALGEVDPGRRGVAGTVRDHGRRRGQPGEAGGRQMRIVVHGQQAFGKAVLERLLERDEDVVGVFCAPDREGRPTDPLKELALERGLPVHQPTSWKTDEALELMRSFDPDLCVMAYVTLLVPQRVLDAPRLGTIQYHPSLLPRHRGPSSINWPIIQGETRTGLTIFWPDEALDEGPILLQKEVAIGPDDTLGSLYFNHLFPMGVDAMIEAVDLVRAGKAPRIPQDDSKATYESWCRKADARIDWSKPAAEVYNLIRGTDPQPGAWTLIDGNEVQIYDSAPSRKVGRARHACWRSPTTASRSPRSAARSWSSACARRAARRWTPARSPSDAGLQGRRSARRLSRDSDKAEQRGGITWPRATSRSPAKRPCCRSARSQPSSASPTTRSSRTASTSPRSASISSSRSPTGPTGA